MAEQRAIYRLNRLMQLSEMDVPAAQKNAGSKSAYFAILDDFYNNFPAIYEAFAAPEVARDPEAFQKGVLELQKHLLAIGASPLLYEAEKAAESLYRGEKRAAAERIHSLAAKVTMIRNKIEEARIAPEQPGNQPGPPGNQSDPPANQSEQPANQSEQPANQSEQPGNQLEPSGNQPEPPGLDMSEFEMSNSDQVPGSASARNPGGTSGAPKTNVKPKVAPNAEAFNLLRDLIGRFETDAAMRQVTLLAASSYTRAIDDTLKAIKTALQGFDHDHAAALTGKLLELATNMRPDAEPENAKKKILAIDDVPDILNTVKSALKDKYIVYGVTNHMAALKFLTNNSADLILLDIEMPDMDGFTLLGIIRKIKAYEATPAVFLTGSVTVENVVKSRKAGGNDFIKKPLDVQVLLAKMAKYLD